MRTIKLSFVLLIIIVSSTGLVGYCTNNGRQLSIEDLEVYSETYFETCARGIPLVARAELYYRFW